MGAWRRRVWIDAVARLRKASLAPWVVFTCWVLFTASQEPGVLRQSGVLLREPAAWTGASLVWLVCVLQKTNEPSRSLDSSATLVLLLFLTAALTSLLLLLADLISHAEHSLWLPLLGAGHYLAALMPVALAVAVGHGLANRPQEYIHKLLMIVSMGPAAAALVAAPLAAGSRLLFAASGLSICASLLLMIAWRRPRQSRLPARRST